tara:strand:- start:1977 stop:3827 length:1851 start_codon:yes stop_codon:yes gene_type:complete
MSSRTSTALPSVANHGDEVTRDGVVYRYNATPPGIVGSTGAARWETVLDRNLDIVTKDTDQSYFTTESTQAQSVSKKNGLLSVPEVDLNFVNLKKALLAIERELTADGGILNRVDINASNFGNVEGSVNNIIQTKANLASPQFTGTPEAPTVTSNNSSTTLATTAFVQNLLGQLQSNLVPQGATTTLGTQASPFQTLFVSQDIVPTSLTGGNFLVDFNGVPQQVNATTVNLGSPQAAFNNIYAKSGFFADESITIGTAVISQSSAGGVILPANSAIGTEDNEIPATFASTLIDERFAQRASLQDTLVGSFTVSGSIDARAPVRMNGDGTVSQILDSTGSTEGFIGLSLTNATPGSGASVVLHGILPGFTGLSRNQNVFVEQDGTLVQTKTSTTKKIGRAISTTSIFLFSTSLDTYVLNQNKIGLTDLSAVNAVASGAGSLTYSDATGQFTFTPPDLSDFATQSYVSSQISNLVGSAPETLDTLNELAAALGDDSNFSTTVTNSLAAKANIESPTFTGTPKAPTASSASNDTTIATTAFVKANGGVSTLNALTNVEITNIQEGQVIAFNASQNKFINQNQSGVGGSGAGGTIDFLVDGGGANVAAASVVIILDGGSA